MPRWPAPASRCRPRRSTRDWTQTYEPNPAVEAAWAEVYRDTDKWWRFYQFAEKLVDIDDALAVWRHKHA